MKESKGFIFFDKDTNFNGIIDASSVVLEGTVTGEVVASDIVYLKYGSCMKGDINTRKILTEEGASHSGSLRLGLNHSKNIQTVNGKEAKPDTPENQSQNEQEIEVSKESEKQDEKGDDEPVSGPEKPGHRLW